MSKKEKIENYDSLESLVKGVKAKLDPSTETKKIMALYAFNATGKTRLTNALAEQDEDNDQLVSLCYNAFLEDMFSWDNESYKLHFDQNGWIIKLLLDEGLEGAIIDNFKDITGSSIEPSFNFVNGTITFSIPSGDEKSFDNIKISRGEESMLIWSIFFTILETAIDSLNTEADNRSTQIFDQLKYIIIDDPVSSIDDTKIITMAIKLINALRSYQGNTLKFFITTHHALFYNVLVNSFKGDREWVFKSYSLSRHNYNYKLSTQGDTPFSYHLSVKDSIQEAIETNTIERYHFNLFRSLLEKTATFLGYNNWDECIGGDENQEFIRLLNLYSHSKISELESRELSGKDKELLITTFNEFIQRFNWK